MLRNPRTGRFGRGEIQNMSTSTFTPDEWAAGLGLAKIRDPNVKSPRVLRMLALRLLQDYGAPSVVRQIGYMRDSEIAKWTGIVWRESPRMNAKEARLAGMERAASEAPWLFSAGALALDPDVPPGPGTFAPAHVVDTAPRKVDVPAPSSAAKARAMPDDDALLVSARGVVRASGIPATDQAFHVQVAKVFRAMRDAARHDAKHGLSAKGGAK